MDYRLALLLHTMEGLNLTPVDLEALTTLPPEAASDSSSVIESLRGENARAYLRRHPDWWRKSEDTFRFSADRGIRWSYPGRPDYPEAWLTLSHRPPVFSYLGQPVWLQWPVFAVVGSRTPTTDTRLWMQRELGRFLREWPVAVVSGGARGVDQWAHRLAVASGRPTVCVYPSGLCNPYPPDRQWLWEEILLQDGCLLSTFPLRAPMRRHYFPIRNRWIAGLSPLIFVVEANRRSGSLLTATLALEEGRDICTLPVSPVSAQGLANLQLLHDGALMVRDADDLKALAGRYPSLAPPSQNEMVRTF